MEALMEKSREKVGTKELTSEIIPILKDYFVANVERKESGIKMTFLNGQAFFLEVREN